MKRFLLLLIVLVLAHHASAFGDKSDSAIVVVANLATPDSALDRDAVLDFYTGDIKVWSDGSRVMLLDLDGHKELRDRFFDYLGKSSSRMRSIWLKNMLSGEGQPPAAMKDEDELIRKVASTPGAIGFVTRDKVSDKVKVLLTINE